LDESLAITPIGPFRARVRPPGSKSLTNRALLLAMLADGESTLRHPLKADDTRRMVGAIQGMGFSCEWEDAGWSVIRVTGKKGAFPAGPQPVTIDVGNAGTVMRFLTAACCLSNGEHLLRGVERMHRRPIGQLVDAVRQLGGRIEYAAEQGFPPLRILGGGLQGGEIVMPPALSSQYISALLQIGPYCPQGLTLRFPGPVTSKPYVQMTLGLMARFGARVEADASFSRVRVEAGGYRATDYNVEPDASNASYFLAAAAIVPGSMCTIEGLGRGSLQGDVGFADVLHKMGAGLLFGKDFITVMAPGSGGTLHGIDTDLNDMPDTAQTLAAVAMFADGPTTIRNVGNLRVKETDRLEALRQELTKLGARVTIDGDDLTIEPPPNHRVQPASLDTYDDHRMAMSLSIIGLRALGIVINDPRCVEKTFPDYFDYLNRLSEPG
jgi:3-phosphoshikimate 1-carboxyvinyltransferase